MSTKTNIQIPVIGTEPTATSQTLPADLFGAPMNENLLTQYIQMHLVNVRQGTASTKDRSQIKATTKKMYKQKGTGNARHGSKKAPIFVGGGVVGGPKPKDYYLKMNKKQKTQVFAAALSQRAKEQEIVVLSSKTDNKDLKTKDMAKLFKTIAEGQLVTLVLHSAVDSNLDRLTRNIKKIHRVYVQSLNAYDILRGKKIVFSDSALSELIKTSKS
ncbi:50S ribosomal protein L4 [Candidatus Woesebacteria bacterium]|nr:50S ribosomal protein L4 [Candidatus Woesebacteria bacterium]